MNSLWDNPVARHAGRLASRGGLRWVAPLLLAAAGLGALLQRYGMEQEWHYFARPQMTVRWLGLVLVTEALVALPWAAARGALLWRRLRAEGHLDEYRRTRLAPASLALGAAAAALGPVLVLVAASLLLALLAHRATRGLPLDGVLLGHLLLACQALAFACLGLWLAGRLRHPAAAIPAALAILAAAVGAIWAVDPLLGRAGDAGAWIYAALLPNPLTAVGSVLGTDVLRFPWLYRHLHAHEYFFVYPPAAQTCGLYLAAAALLLGAVARRAARAE